MHEIHLKYTSNMCISHVENSHHVFLGIFGFYTSRAHVFPFLQQSKADFKNKTFLQGTAKNMSMEERGFKEANVVAFNILNPNNMIHTCVVNVSAVSWSTAIHNVSLFHKREHVPVYPLENDSPKNTASDGYH